MKLIHDCEWHAASAWLLSFVSFFTFCHVSVIFSSLFVHVHIHVSLFHFEYSPSTSPPMSSHLWLRWLAPLVSHWFSLPVLCVFLLRSQFATLSQYLRLTSDCQPRSVFYIFRLYPDWFEEVQTAEKLHEIQFLLIGLRQLIRIQSIFCVTFWHTTATSNREWWRCLWAAEQPYPSLPLQAMQIGWWCLDPKIWPPDCKW